MIKNNILVSLITKGEFETKEIEMTKKTKKCTTCGTPMYLAHGMILRCLDDDCPTNTPAESPFTVPVPVEGQTEWGIREGHSPDSDPVIVPVTN